MLFCMIQYIRLYEVGQSQKLESFLKVPDVQTCDLMNFLNPIGQGVPVDKEHFCSPAHGKTFFYEGLHRKAKLIGEFFIGRSFRFQKLRKLLFRNLFQNSYEKEILHCIKGTLKVQLDNTSGGVLQF